MLPLESGRSDFSMTNRNEAHGTMRMVVRTPKAAMQVGKTNMFIKNEFLPGRVDMQQSVESRVSFNKKAGHIPPRELLS